MFDFGLLYKVEWHNNYLYGQRKKAGITKL